LYSLERQLYQDILVNDGSKEIAEEYVKRNNFYFIKKNKGYEKA